MQQINKQFIPDLSDTYLPRLENQDATKNPNAIYLNWATIAGNAVGVQIVAMGYSTLNKSFIQTSVSVPVAGAGQAGIVLPALVNQVQQNRNDIENILQTGTTPLDLPTRAALASYPATASGVKVGQDTTVLADEGQGGSLTKWVYDPDYDTSLYPNATVVNGFRFRFIGQEVPYVIATATTAGLVLSVETSVPGQIKVEEDGTMSVWGWDAISDAVSDLQTAVAPLSVAVPSTSAITGTYPNLDLKANTPTTNVSNVSLILNQPFTALLGLDFDSYGRVSVVYVAHYRMPSAATVANAVAPLIISHAADEATAQTQSAANPNIYVSFDIVE